MTGLDEFLLPAPMHRRRMARLVTRPAPMLAAVDRVEELARELKAAADCHPAATEGEVGLCAAVWVMADGLRNLALLGRPEACEMVLARALAAFEGEVS
jgi:hypothetical protein